MNTGRMLLRLYMFPILLFIGSLIVSYILGTILPNGFSGNFSILGEKARSITPIAGVSLLGFSGLWFIVNSYKLWQWDRGNGYDACHVCGGLTSYHANGRYGPYFKCMACGKNRADKF